jgi:hypothetical protein
MFPDLIPAIVLFYLNDPGWRRLVENTRSRLGIFGFSLVEDFLSRVQAYRRIGDPGGRLGALIRFATEYGGFLAKLPYADDYVVSLLRHPQASIGYYRSVFREWRENREERLEKLQMVGR